MLTIPTGILISNIVIYRYYNIIYGRLRLSFKVNEIIHQI
jgi:hypothetical protein